MRCRRQWQRLLPVLGQQYCTTGQQPCAELGTVVVKSALRNAHAEECEDKRGDLHGARRRFASARIRCVSQWRRVRTKSINFSLKLLHGEGLK